MPARGDRGLRARALLTLLVLVSACAKQAPRQAQAPLPPDDIGAIERRLDDNADDLAAQGIGASTGAAEVVTEDDADAAVPAPTRVERETVSRGKAKAGPPRCTRICDLAQATCELRDHICGLAREHPDDARYTEACARAESQCTAASNACDTCG